MDHPTTLQKSLLAAAGLLLTRAACVASPSHATSCPGPTVEFREYEFVRAIDDDGAVSDENPTVFPDPLILRAGEHEPGTVLVDNWEGGVLLLVPKSD